MGFWGTPSKPVRSSKRSSTPFWNTKPLTKAKSRAIKPTNLFGGHIKHKPLNIWKPNSIRSIPKKNLSYSQAKRRYPNLNPFKDADRDGVPNWLDCKPFNRRKQGIIQKLNPHEVSMLKDFVRKRYSSAGRDPQTFDSHAEIDNTLTYEENKHLINDKLNVLLPRVIPKLKRDTIMSEEQIASIQALEPPSYPEQHRPQRPYTPKKSKDFPLLVLSDMENPRLMKNKEEYNEYFEESKVGKTPFDFASLDKSRPQALMSLDKDTDKDGVVDYADCEPTNPKKQGWLHRQEIRRSLIDKNDK